ncbi:MAG: transcription-repair coupling factor, partial [Vicinamibacteria bacterium]|nr:transcription-repair coupling factor [Vicinamibacteria bacterium]
LVEYAGESKLYVPLTRLDLIQKFRGSAEGAPSMDRLGGVTWAKTKSRVKAKMRDMAEELLKLYAERKARPGRAFAAISPWMSEFEAAFPFDETPDQHTAIADVAEDMASRTPMDRLICGDVGYGKTEVAMRASMRAVLEGTQVAVLAPTTVLAFQHQQTFRRRFAPFPVRIEMVSRLRRPGENKAVLEQLKAGQIDILIGTHRLLSKDVEFRELGLIIIDEEQRFGVAAKERLKHMRTTVDCLTLSATPIPRTLQMGMTAIRDMSIIETPPKDRLAIHTSIVKFSTETIAAAIRQELARDGQVYFVHNRIESIFSMGHLIEKLCPEARVAVAHGQMPEAVLEQAMLAFVEGRVNVLVSTTIIENGLDIPRANTIVINRADRLGLAQLYQLRGRVGRADLQAQALLLVPPDTILSEVARKRLAAIREFSDLGAGFRIAALDLELRGAGDLLGGRQSGHIEAVGFDLYMKLLDQTVRELKGEAQPETPRALLNLGLDIRIPEDYVPQSDQRISLYKRVSQVRDLSEIDRLRGEWRDRFGPLPPATESLLRLAELRLRAEALGVTQIDKTQDALVIRMAAEPPPRAPGLMAYVTSARDVTLSPAGYLRVRRDAGRPALDELDHVLAQLAREPKRPLAL